VDHRDDLLSKREASKIELPHKTEKQTVNCNLPQTAERVDGTMNLPQGKREGQRTKFSVLSSQ
jgi:hypothetical protein